MSVETAIYIIERDKTTMFNLGRIPLWSHSSPCTQHWTLCSCDWSVLDLWPERPAGSFKAHTHLHWHTWMFVQDWQAAACTGLALITVWVRGGICYHNVLSVVQLLRPSTPVHVHLICFPSTYMLPTAALDLHVTADMNSGLELKPLNQT